MPSSTFNFKKALFILLIIFFPVIGVGSFFSYYVNIRQFDTVESRIAQCLGIFNNDSANTLLVVGNSIAKYGIHPECFYPAGGTSQNRLQGYNFSIGGFYTPYILNLLEAVGYYPAVIVIDINFRTVYFGSNEKYVTFIKYSRTPGFESFKYFFEKKLQALVCTYADFLHPNHSFKIKELAYHTYKRKRKEMGYYFGLSQLMHLRNEKKMPFSNIQNPDCSTSLISAGRFSLDTIPDESQVRNRKVVETGVQYASRLLTDLEMYIARFRKAGTKFIFVRSPYPYRAYEDTLLKENNIRLSDFFKNLEVPFFNFPPNELPENLYYGDFVHLEYSSAVRYSRFLSKKIQPLLAEKN